MQLEIFKFQLPEEEMLNELRTIEIDGEIWFSGADVAKTLGYSNPRDALSRHCKPKGVVKHDIPTASGLQALTFINESNVYRLVIKSKLPAAERFEEWIFEEVIPSIRKKGFYGKIDRTQAPNFYLRYQENYHKIDRNYFSVISELFVTLNVEFEKVGYTIPNKGIDDKGMYPDISVGKMFSSYLKKTNSVHLDTHKTYPHSFTDGRPDVDARMYPLEVLPEFRKFVFDVWLPEQAPKYFRGKDPIALDYLPKLLN
ncbi:Bro-N domain-containing protein [Chryseobacterium sp. Leaf180]|uniref:BRO-N domain-containing protein n=1 Tax=Chryseobacterium sp. Leaf180 TaxID=1736289 RepID=UPI0009EC9450|nr:BRO family protein [Chryseobacterium sp. Leaf180]